MYKGIQIILVILLMTWASGSARAAEPFVYPSEGQSPEQTEKDKFECYSWAKKQTGFDPMQPPQAAPTPPSASAEHKGQVVGGAATGAALGAIGGAIAGNAGKGAAIGAATGGGLGALRKRSDRRNQQAQYQQQVEQQQSQYNRKRSEYDRAYSACMEGRGYTLK
jgi:hypothetical protein